VRNLRKSQLRNRDYRVVYRERIPSARTTGR